MAYVQNVPQATQQINTSQPIINANFVGLYTTWGINHSPLLGTGVSPDGKHIKVDVLNSATHPAVTGTDLLIYNYLNTDTSAQELYVKKQAALGTAGIPFTAKNMANGWTYLPSGLLVKWGSSNKSGLGSVDITTGPNYDGATQPVAFVMNKWTSATADSYARLVDISIAAQPVMRVWCSFLTAPTTATTAYFNYIVIGVPA